MQLLTERLSTGCALLLLWCCFASLDWEPFFCLCSSFTVMQLCNSLTKGLFSHCAQLLQLLCNSWLWASLLPMLSSDCVAVEQLLIEPLSGYALLLLCCYCALDWEPLFLLCSAFTVMLLCNPWLKVSLLAVLSFKCGAIVQLLTMSLFSGCDQLLWLCCCWASLDFLLPLLSFYCDAIVQLLTKSLFSGCAQLLLCNSWLRATLLAVLSFYCVAIEQPLTESLCSGCTQLLLWCYCAIAD